MDYVFFSAIIGVATLVTVAYNIACQWHKNLWHRAKLLPNSLQPIIGRPHVDFKIRKLHLQAHEWKCQPVFSFNYAYGVG
jgi:hypothetical protein